jgi:ATP-dependent DNA helicase RecG
MTGYKLSKESRQRIDLMCATNDGFELAEADLRMRGPGDIEGTQQSGLAIDLKISNLAQDSQILQLARMTAEEILDRDPSLSGGDNTLLVSQLALMKKQDELVDIDYSKIS